MKKHLTTVAIFLLAGAVVNVAVAWGCDLWVPTFWESRPVLSQDAERQVLLKLAPADWANREPWVNRVQWFGRTWTYVNTMDRDAHAILIEAYGWPFRAIQRHPPLRQPLYSLLWLGVTFNTLFYAAILWPLILGPFALRRLIRRRRGLCPACGYDLSKASASECPECGTPIEKR